MVKRVFDLMYKEVRGLHRAAYVLALFAFLSQVLALVRDRLLAYHFGAGAVLDMYYSAFRIPDILFVLFASSLSVYVLIPFVSRAYEDSAAVASRLLGSVATFFVVAYGFIALFLGILAPWYTPLVFPGIADQETLVLLIRILLFQPLFLGLSSLFGVMTQLSHRFVLYAISPLLYNLGIIFGVVVLYPYWGEGGLATGVVLGAVLHAGIQWPYLRSHEVKITIGRYYSWKLIKPVLALSVPRALALSANQLVLFALISIAGLLTVGSVAVFQFAYNLQSVPLAIIGMSYSVAAFPTLAQLYSAKEKEKFTAHVVTALRHIIFWSMPVIALCIVLRAQLVRVILGSGLFNWEDTRLTAAVFAVLVISLVANGIQLLLIRTFYAAGNTRVPVLVTVVGAVLAVAALYGTYVWYPTASALRETIATMLRVRDVAGTEVMALAFVYTIMVLLQGGALLVFARRFFVLPVRKLCRPFFVSLTTATLGGVLAYFALQFLVAGLQTDTFIGIALQGLLAGMVGVVGVIIGYTLLRSPELAEIHRSLTKRLKRTEVLPPEQELV